MVDAGVKTGVRIRYENPRDVGADRVVDCAAVQVKYGGPACVVDFGTATTFDAMFMKLGARTLCRSGRLVPSDRM